MDAITKAIQVRKRGHMNNCERCCFFEGCTRLGRIENKDCIYGNKADKDKGESCQAAVVKGNTTSYQK